MRRFSISLSAAQQLRQLDPSAPSLDIQVGVFERLVGLEHPSPSEIWIEGSLSWLKTWSGGKTVRVPISMVEAETLIATTSRQRRIRRTYLSIGEGLLLEHQVDQASVDVLPRCSSAALIALAATE